MSKTCFRIGTRGSPLALTQANWVKNRLTERHPGLEVELRIIKTQGDKIQDVPLAQVGGKGLFVKEIEEALLTREVDLAVHSMKDMPGELPPGLKIGAVPEREDPRDVFLSREPIRFEEVPLRGKIGTSSLRRKAQLLFQRPDLEVLSLRGNLDTRIRKMETLDLDGIILAAAGLHRLGLGERIRHYLEPEFCLPAVGQGALALEIRDPDPGTWEWIAFLHHEETSLCTRAERAFLKRLEGGCQVPLAGQARIAGDRLILTGLIAGLEGEALFREQQAGPLSGPEALGAALADLLLQMGGREILEKAYGFRGTPVNFE
ncbi:MAG: hydroxymethylbilane synthase [Deltaproteobacteria bacterium]|nr:hydroxymethylbilane synthase [Deltaproteobacteria bacterium]